MPDKLTLSKEVFNINSKADRQAVTADKLMLEMAMPDGQDGTPWFVSPTETEKWLRELFEKSMRGFYKVTISDEWDVAKGNVKQNWPIEKYSDSTNQYFPHMELGFVLMNRSMPHKVVIDTKFTSLLKSGWIRDETFSSAYIYQMYAYLRSQEEKGCREKHATGIFLHPAMSASKRHLVHMQGHTFIFAMVNLNAEPKNIRSELLDLIEFAHEEYKMNNQMYDYGNIK